MAAVAGGDPGEPVSPLPRGAREGRGGGLRILYALAASLLAAVLLILHPPPAAADPGDLIDDWLAEVAFTGLALSPEGNRLAFATRQDDPARDVEEHTLWWIDLAAPEPRKPVRLTTGQGEFPELRWSPNGTLLSWFSNVEGSQQLHILDPRAGNPRQVTDAARFPTGVLAYDWLPDGSGVVLAAGTPPTEAEVRAEEEQRKLYGDIRRLPAPPSPRTTFYRLARADFATGKAVAIASAEPDVASIRISPDGSRVAFTAGNYFGPVRTWEVSVLPLGPQAAAPLRTSNWIYEDRLLWTGGDLLDDLLVTGSGEERDGRATNTEGRLHRLENSRLSRIAPNLEGNIQEAIPLADGSVLLTAMISTRTRVYRVEPATGGARTLADHRGTITFFTASRDGRRIAFVRFDRRFPEIWLSDGPDGFQAARALTSFNAKLDSHPAPEIETISWSNGEGDTIEGVLLWPPGRRGAKGLPLVVSLHGGPYGVARQEALSLGGTVTTFPGLLASRGFLVLSPNFRGGAGRGDAFAQAIEGHRCSRQSADVITGVEHLIAQGWADRERMAVSGYSGGGVLTNCLIGRTDLFRAAVSGAGRWDDAGLVGSPRGALWAESFYLGRFPWDDPARYQEESPSARAAQVKTPTLIVYGERDGAEQGAQIYWSLFWRGVPAELQVYPGEGHIFTRPSHKRTKVLTEISWLERYLLGRN